MSKETANLTDSVIDDFLSQMAVNSMTEVNEHFTHDSISAIAFASSTLVDSVKLISELPPQSSVDQFIKTTRNRELIAGLKNPYVELAFSLNQDFTVGSAPVINKITEFYKNNKHIMDIEDDADYQRQNSYIINALNEVIDYMPCQLPKIAFKSIRDLFFMKTPNVYDNLKVLGKNHYISLASEIFEENIPNITDLSEYIGFAQDTRLIRSWELIFSEQVKEEKNDSELHFDSFYAYIGALFKCHQYNDAKILVTTLLTPLLNQFCCEEADETDDYLEKVLEMFPECDIYTLFSYTNEEDASSNRFIVQLAYNGFVLGTSSGSTMLEAKQKSALIAINNSEILLEAKNNYQSRYINYIIPPEYEDINLNVNRFTLHHHETSQEVLQQPQFDHEILDQQVDDSMVPLELPELPVFFVEPDGNYELASNAKEKLNILLNQNKLSAARYPTNKISNSEVEVILTVENFPLARVISINKVRGGRFLAQSLISYFDYFHEVIKYLVLQKDQAAAS